MRFTLIVASAAAILLAASKPLPAQVAGNAGVMPAIASAVLVIQDAQDIQNQPPRGGDVDVNIGVDDGTVWYANPVWIAIGLLAIVVVGLVIGMAARGGGSSGSTIVR